MRILTYPDEPYGPEFLESETLIVSDPEGKPHEVTMAFCLAAQYNALCKTGLSLKVKFAATEIARNTNLPFDTSMPLAIAHIFGPTDEFFHS